MHSCVRMEKSTLANIFQLWPSFSISLIYCPIGQFVHSCFQIESCYVFWPAFPLYCSDKADFLRGSPEAEHEAGTKQLYSPEGLPDGRVRRDRHRTVQTSSEFMKNTLKFVTSFKRVNCSFSTNLKICLGEKVCWGIGILKNSYMISTEFKSAPSIWFNQLKLNLILFWVKFCMEYNININQDRHRTICLIFDFNR